MSEEAILRLSEMGRRLNLRAGAAHLPHLYFMTDSVRTPDPVQVAEHLREDEPAEPVVERAARDARVGQHLDRLGVAVARRDVQRRGAAGPSLAHELRL